MKNTLKTFREENRLTQEQLAAVLGVSRQTIISIESGKYTASLELALKLGRYFQVPVETLFSLDSEVQQ